MIRALYSAASGMTAQQLNVDNIANNLANANTSRLQVAARAVPGPALSEYGAAGRGRRPADHGADRPATRPRHARRVQRDHLHAGQLFTDRQSAGRGDPGQRLLPDPARPRAIWPTRATARSSWIRTATSSHRNGDPLEPQITIPSRRAVHHHRTGRHGQLLDRRARSAAQKAGQIQLAGFQNPAGLNSLGKNLYQPTDASGDPTVAAPGGQEGLGTLLQGYTEQSNVSIVEEFINLIVAQRAYEANSKVVKAADDMYQQVNNLKQ